jgi:N-acyl-D-aspartate/D-glutamate deacylase
MRAKEFIIEQATNGLSVASFSLPKTYIMPELKNSDFYELYRFGLAIAAVRGEGGEDDGVQNKFKNKFEAESDWGEHQIVSSEFDEDLDNTIDKALKKVGKSSKILTGTLESSELPNTNIQSTLKPFKGYKK